MTTTTTPKSKAPQPNLMDKLGASMKAGGAKMAAATAPKPATPVNRSPTGKPGPSVFVAMAQVSESNGNLDDAEAQYKKALAIEPGHLAALVGYAHLEDRRNNFEAAEKLYQRAIKKHPKESSVHNDLGLCYHRRGMLPEATKSLQRAVALNGDNKLYRNNLAAVLVEQNKPKEALAQLTAAHGQAVGHYNLGYLLTQKHDNAAAMEHFQRAADLDPSMIPARQWIAKLSSELSSGPQIVAASTISHTRPTQVNMPQVDMPAVDTSMAYATAAMPPQPEMPSMTQDNASHARFAAQSTPEAVTPARSVQFPQTQWSRGAQADAMPPVPEASKN